MDKAQAIKIARFWREVATTLEQLLEHLDANGVVNSFADNVEALANEASEYATDTLEELCGES